MISPAPVGDIPEKSFQPPDHNFPKREFGQTSKVYRYLKVPGLADGNFGCTMMPLTNDIAFSHLCMMGSKSGKLSSSSESTFIFSGFSKLERCY